MKYLKSASQVRMLAKAAPFKIYHRQWRNWLGRVVAWSSLVSQRCLVWCKHDHVSDHGRIAHCRHNTIKGNKRSFIGICIRCAGAHSADERAVQQRMEWLQFCRSQ